MLIMRFTAVFGVEQTKRKAFPCVLIQICFMKEGFNGPKRLWLQSLLWASPQSTSFHGVALFRTFPCHGGHTLCPCWPKGSLCCEQATGHWIFKALTNDKVINKSSIWQAGIVLFFRGGREVRCVWAGLEYRWVWYIGLDKLEYIWTPIEPAVHLSACEPLLSWARVQVSSVWGGS